ncbi:hypothetical protein ACHAP6_005511 [Verticillium nonalfalfae]
MSPTLSTFTRATTPDIEVPSRETLRGHPIRHWNRQSYDSSSSTFVDSVPDEDRIKDHSRQPEIDEIPEVEAIRAAGTPRPAADQTDSDGPPPLKERMSFDVGVDRLSTGWDADPADSADEEVEGVLNYVLQAAYGVDLDEIGAPQNLLRRFTSRFIQDVGRIAFSGPPTTQLTHTTSNSSRSTVLIARAPTRTSQTGKRKKGGPSRDGTEDDEDISEDDADGGAPFKRARQIVKETEENLRLSCPFRKRNPARFNVREHHSCAMTYFPKFAELRQHIVKQHKRVDPSAFVCDRCNRDFAARKDLRDHQRLPRELMCDIADHDPECGIDGPTAAKLLSRKRAGGTSAEVQWMEIWNLVFPDDGDHEVVNWDFCPVIEHFEVTGRFLASLKALEGSLRNKGLNEQALETIGNVYRNQFIQVVEHYHIGVLSSILVHPGWQEMLNHPKASTKGIITGIYYLGTFLSYIFVSHPLSDWLGRRYAALSGVGILILGTALQATSNGGSALVTMILGRMVSGVGVAIVSTSVPLYQAEVSPAKQRGHFVTMNHVGFIAGLATGLWVGYFMTYWTSASGHYYGWRLSICLELVPALTFAAGLPWIPETPRWLVENGHLERAKSTLRWLREGMALDAEVDAEFAAITRNVDAYYPTHTSWLALFREPALFARLWRAAALQFMATLCGATAMKYYLPTLLKALGLETRVALMAGAAEMTIKIGFTVLEMFLIDRFGRRMCLVAGCSVMAVAMMINGALPIAYPDNSSKIADVICIIFIFVYALGYSLGFGPASWVYNTEIFPTSVRARGLNFAASGGSVGSIIVSHVWPVGRAALGSKVYFIFMVVNVLCIPIILIFYPETKGIALEDMDALFGKVATAQGVDGGRQGLEDTERLLAPQSPGDAEEPYHDVSTRV